MRARSRHHHAATPGHARDGGVPPLALPGQAHSAGSCGVAGAPQRGAGNATEELAVPVSGGAGGARMAPPAGALALDADTTGLAVANALMAAAMARGSGADQVDPALALANSWNAQTEPGSITGLTAAVLAQYLTEFHAGQFANCARVWDVLEKRDDACLTASRKLRAKVLRRIRTWQIQTADDSPAAERQREFLQRFYNRLTADSAVNNVIRGGLRLAAQFALDAVGKQYSFLAKAWTGRGPTLSLTLRHVPLWFFGRVQGQWRFDPSGMGVPQAPVDVAQWALAAQPMALMEAASILALFKRLPTHQLVHILEKWGVPSVYGECGGPKGSEAWQAMFEAVQNIRSGFSGVVGSGGKINTLEPRGAAGATIHRPWIQDCSDGITQIWLGGALSTSAKADTGSLAGGAQADDTDDLVDDLVDWVVDFMQEQVDRDALRYGLGVTDPLAWFSIPAETRSAGTERMAVFQAAVAMGAQIPFAQIYDEFDLQHAEDDEETLQPPAAGPAPVPFPGEQASGAALPAEPSLDLTKTALNGAQVQALVEILRSSAAGEIPESSVLPVLRAAFPMVDAAILTKLAGSVKGFTPRSAPAAAGNARKEGDGILPSAASVIAAGNAAGGRSAKAAQADLQALEAEALKEFGPAYADALQSLFKAAAEAPDLDAVRALIGGAKLPADAKAKLADIVARTVHAADLRGYLADGVRVELAPLPPKEALAFWAQKIPMPDGTLPAEFIGKRWDQAVAYGFKVAGITERSVLDQVSADIESALQGGPAAPTVAEFVRTAQDKYGMTAPHAETVIRTNVQTAYQYGHYQRLNAVREAMPIWAFDVVNDDRTSDTCRALLGKAYPANHPIWDSLYPPNHYNCRTTVVPFESVEEAQAQGFTVSDAWPRDPDTGGYFMPTHGFEMNVGTVPTLDAVLPDAEAATP